MTDETPVDFHDVLREMSLIVGQLAIDLAVARAARNAQAATGEPNEPKEG